MSIIAQYPANYGICQPVAGTALQSLKNSTYAINQGFVGADLTTPANAALAIEASSIFNGVPTRVVWAGVYISHGASQTVKFTLAVAPFATAPSYTALITPGTASGTLTAGTAYPFFVEAMLIGWSGNDSAGTALAGNLGGVIRSVVGDVPTANAFAATANVTGFTFGNVALAGTAAAPANILSQLPRAGASSAYPINGVNGNTGAAPAALILPQFVQSVSDTAAVVMTTAFYVSVD